MGLEWMSWTWQTGLFFAWILLMLIGMVAWELKSPGGGARLGILGLTTTRGDRLFISLLGAAFIHLIWLGLFGKPLYAASAISLVYALAVFRWV